MKNEDIITKLEAYALKLIHGDDMGEWGDHKDNFHGQDILRIIHDDPSGFYSSYRNEWIPSDADHK